MVVLGIGIGILLCLIAFVIFCIIYGVEADRSQSEIIRADCISKLQEAKKMLEG